MTPTPESKARTGRAFRTRSSVLWGDRIARFFISLGGLGTVIAVITVCGFLVGVAAPLFLPGDIAQSDSYGFTGRSGQLVVDDYQRLFWTLNDDAEVELRRCDNGELLDTIPLAPGKKVSAANWSNRAELLCVGFEDGAVQLFAIDFAISYPQLDENPELAALQPGARKATSWKMPGGKERAGLVENLVQGDYRGLSLRVTSHKAKTLGAGPVVTVGQGITSDGAPVVCAVLDVADEASRIQLIPTRKSTNMMTGDEELRFLRAKNLDWEARGAGLPKFARVGVNGAQIYVLWEDGAGLRYRYTKPDVYIAERIDLAPEHEKLTAVDFILGGETLISGTNTGRVDGWFVAPSPEESEGYVRVPYRGAIYLFAPGSAALERFRRSAEVEQPVKETMERTGLELVAPDEGVIDAYKESVGADDFVLVHAKKMQEPTGNGVTALALSERTRLVAAGFTHGEVAVFQVTSAGEILRAKVGSGRDVASLSIAPRDDGLLAISDEQATLFKVDVGFPEAGFSTLFAPIQYEGYAEPLHVWQSSSADDASEPKLGLMPLVFGTLKVTAYSLLFGVPLALFAALFTSELLDRKQRGKIKTTIEMMASLPSVVLGFIAAQVIAPWAADRVSGVLACLMCIPFMLMLGGCLWQLLPTSLTRTLVRFRFVFITAMMPLAFLLAFSVVGPLLEGWLFLGDIKSYLNGHRLLPTRGERLGGWLFLCAPTALLLVAFLNAQLSGRVREIAGSWSRRKAAVWELGRFLLNTVAVAGLALLFASICAQFGDLRGEQSVLDTYIQRNALIVSCVMGFAIIPIIYTLAEDALSAVPDDLRWASLAAGATPWQGAIRIVVPAATGGVFSAVMVGMGRALGETMIVLMAAGNTPIMSWNIFDGFRTLSANIATELPEAVQGSTHYRTLFLSALLLFALTFILNTLAESLRQRHRRKVGQ